MKENKKEYIDLERMEYDLRNLRYDIEYKKSKFKKRGVSKGKYEKLIRNTTKAMDELTKELDLAPPRPELPPQGPLFKIEGMIEELEIRYIKNYFNSSHYYLGEYDYERNIKENRYGVFSDGPDCRELSNSDFVKGRINGKKFYGWLGRTVIKEGDYVEMVVVEKDDCYIVYAITLPEKRILMMTPKCEHGRYILILEGARCAFFFYLIMLFLTALIMIGMEKYLEKILYIMSVPYPMMFFVLYLFFAVVCLIRPSPTIKLAERIFVALGVPNYKSKSFDLKRISKFNEISEEEIELFLEGEPHRSDLYFY
ncbi:putative type VI secretion system effector [Xenorhabdus szentirmaii]|uniref:putative type VI secretion system effector n=1 Tax=Xenorhabdus szentirmaii TaxID=290112 RepID=UPI0032B73CEE